VCLPTVGLRQRGELDGVAEQRPGAVCLDHADGVGVHVGDRERIFDDRRLPVDARSREADPGSAIVVDGRSPDDRVDGVGVRDRVFEALERDERDASGDDRSLGVGVEGPHVPVGREDVAFLIDVAGPERHHDARPAGEREVAFPRQQALHGKVDRDPGGGAGGVDGHGRTKQPQLERGPQDGVLALVPEHDGVVACQSQQLRVRQQVVAEVLVPADAAKDTDPAVAPARVVAGVLEGVPGGLQHDAVLRVGQLGLAAPHAEEVRVELLDAVHLCAGVHEPGIVDIGA
jgi:hypothetical protein